MFKEKSDVFWNEVSKVTLMYDYLYINRTDNSHDADFSC